MEGDYLTIFFPPKWCLRRVTEPGREGGEVSWKFVLSLALLNWTHNPCVKRDDLETKQKVCYVDFQETKDNGISFCCLSRVWKRVLVLDRNYDLGPFCTQGFVYFEWTVILMHTHMHMQWKLLPFPHLHWSSSLTSPLSTTYRLLLLLVSCLLSESLHAYTNKCEFLFLFFYIEDSIL